MAPRKRKAAEVEPATEQANKLRSVCKAMDDSAAELCCPITQELPIDPVTAEDGRVYERSAIEEWLSTNEKSPHTNEPMGKKLLPALQVKNMIAKMVESGALSGDKCAAWTLKLEQEKQVEKMREKAEAGDAQAMTSLSHWHLEGKYVKKDLVSSFQWAKRAADLDDARGMTMVASCYLHGEGTTKSERTGLMCFAQAAALGSEHACYVLAYGYHHGEYGLERSSALASHWAGKMQRAAGTNTQDGFWLGPERHRTSACTLCPLGSAGSRARSIG